MSELAKKLYYRKGGSTVAIKRYSDVAEMSGKPYLCTKSTETISKTIADFEQKVSNGQYSYNNVNLFPYTVKAGENRLLISGYTTYAEVVIYNNGIYSFTAPTAGERNYEIPLTTRNVLTLELNTLSGSSNNFVELHAEVTKEVSLGYSPLVANGDYATDLSDRIFKWQRSAIYIVVYKILEYFQLVIRENIGSGNQINRAGEFTSHFGRSAVHPRADKSVTHGVTV
jgi:hypothetical protein